jgi:membrane fusion protein, multidrug efflux system
MQKPSQRSFVVFYVVAAVFIIAAAALVWYLWQDKQKQAAEEAQRRAAAVAAGPTVTLAQAVRGPNLRRVTLVGEALPYKSATLYSKVSGYLTKMAVDVGSRVNAGQLIAEIQSPEIDHQMHTAQVALDNKRRVLQRTRDLATQGFFSQQSLENAETDVRVAESQLAELRTMGAYRTLKAPFSGVITQRFADPGALVTNASSNQSAALPLVTLADVSQLRVSVYVEQGEAPNVRPGLEAEIVDGANVQRKAQGKVARVSGELDPRTRTLLAEVDFDNRDGKFVAGSFVNVTLLIPATSYIEVPAAALITREKKNFVGVVDANNKVELRPIDLAGTDGKVLRIAGGLNEGERVALSLPASIADGAQVNPAPQPGAPAAAPPKAAAAPQAPPAPGAKATSSAPATPPAR